MSANDESTTGESNPFAAAALPDRMHKHAVAALTERIEGEIRNRHLRSGARLDMEVTLAARYDASSAVVTDALTGLETMGLLKRQPYGALISAKPVQWLIECSGLCFPSIIEQFEMRLLVAPACAAGARLHAGDPDLAELDHHSARISARAAAGEPTFEAEREFNLALAEIAGNPLLIAPTRQLWNLLEGHTWHIIRHSAEGPAEWAETAADYAAIAAAVERGNAATAHTAMRHHLRHLDCRYFRGRAVGGAGTEPAQDL